MSHETTVTVTNNNGTLTTSVGDPQLKPKGKKTLKWTLATSGYVFPADGITVQNNTGQFTNFSPASNGQSFTVDDANSDTRTYNYTVTVQSATNPKIRVRVDPTIRNGEST